MPTGAYSQPQRGRYPYNSPPRPPKPAPQVTRSRVTCPYCEHYQNVSEYAFSVVCTHCNRSIELRDLDIRSHLKENINTGSVVRVLQSGSVHGAVRANEVVVEGAIVGDIVAGERVRIAASGVVQGGIRSRRLHVEEGAVFQGDGNIGKQAFPPPLAAKKRGRKRRR